MFEWEAITAASFSQLWRTMHHFTLYAIKTACANLKRAHSQWKKIACETFPSHIQRATQASEGRKVRGTAVTWRRVGSSSVSAGQHPAEGDKNLRCTNIAPWNQGCVAAWRPPDAVFTQSEVSQTFLAWDSAKSFIPQFTAVAKKVLVCKPFVHK